MEPTDTNCAAVEAAVKSMAGMPKFPKWEPDAQAALIKAFLRKFATSEEAEQAVCEFLDHWLNCPTVNDVLYAERVPGSWAAANEAHAASARQQDCAKCDNTGFAHHEVPHTETVADFCGCEFGKLLAGRPYGRENRMDQLRARRVKCAKCHETGEVSRTVDATFSAVRRCDCAVGKMMAGKAKIEHEDSKSRPPQRVGREAAAGRDA